MDLLRHVVFRRPQPELSLWCYLELFMSKQESRTLTQFYADFNKLFEKVKEIFPRIGDVKEMHERWNKLMVLVILGALCYLRSTTSRVLEGSIECDCYHHCQVTWGYTSLLTWNCSFRITESNQLGSLRIILLLQSKIEHQEVEVGGVIFEAETVVVPWWSFKRTGMRCDLFYYCKKPGHTKYNYPLLQEKKQQ